MEIIDFVIGALIWWLVFIILKFIVVKIKNLSKSVSPEEFERVNREANRLDSEIKRISKQKVEHPISNGLLCPECTAFNPINSTKCNKCGYEFNSIPIQTTVDFKHEDKKALILQNEKQQPIDPKEGSFDIFITKIGNNPLRVFEIIASIKNQDPSEINFESVQILLLGEALQKKVPYQSAYCMKTSLEQAGATIQLQSSSMVK